MATTLALRPKGTTHDGSGTRLRTVGLALGFVGLGLAITTLVNAIAAGVLAGREGEATTVAGLLAWSFGLTTTAFGAVKLGIAIVLTAILVRLWIRVDAVTLALPALRDGAVDEPLRPGRISTPYGPADVAPVAPRPLFVHRMARALWSPMLAMGAMAVAAGLVVSIVQANTVATDPALAASQSAWVQGLQFLGEGMLLGGISFLLGTILFALRTGGGEVQESLGVPVTTLAMPRAAKAFVGLMMLGVMVQVFQFVAYVVVATIDGPRTIAAAFAWLGPVREAGLGLLLTGIVLALAAIARAVGFQFWRLRQLVTAGR